VSKVHKVHCKGTGVRSGKDLYTVVYSVPELGLTVSPDMLCVSHSGYLESGRSYWVAGGLFCSLSCSGEGACLAESHTDQQCARCG
jgi:hypothetical protein